MDLDLSLCQAAALPQQGQQRKGGQVRQPSSSGMGRGKPARRGGHSRPTFPSPPTRTKGQVTSGPPRRAAAPPRHTSRSHAASFLPSPGTSTHQMAHFGHRRSAAANSGLPPGAGQGHAAAPAVCPPAGARPGPGDGDSLGRRAPVHISSPLSLQRGPVWKILRRQRLPYPARYRAAALLRPPLPPVLPQTGADLAPTPTDSAGPAPAPPVTTGRRPRLPPAPQFPPTPSPREQDMRRGRFYAGGG